MLSENMIALSKHRLAIAKERLNTCLSKNYYDSAREWAYKDVQPRIIAEQYITNLLPIVLIMRRFLQ